MLSLRRKHVIDDIVDIGVWGLGLCIITSPAPPGAGGETALDAEAAVGTARETARPDGVPPGVRGTAAAPLADGLWARHLPESPGPTGAEAESPGDARSRTAGLISDRPGWVTDTPFASQRPNRRGKRYEKDKNKETRSN